MAVLGHKLSLETKLNMAGANISPQPITVTNKQARNQSFDYEKASILLNIYHIQVNTYVPSNKLLKGFLSQKK